MFFRLNMVTGLISMTFSAFKLLVELLFASEYRKSIGSLTGAKGSKVFKVLSLEVLLLLYKLL